MLAATESPAKALKGTGSRANHGYASKKVKVVQKVQDAVSVVEAVQNAQVKGVTADADWSGYAQPCWNLYRFWLEFESCFIVAEFCFDLKVRRPHLRGGTVAE